MKVVFLTDMDDTLWSVYKPPVGLYTCMTQGQQRESFMRDDNLELLYKIMERIPVVPVTSRSKESVSCIFGIKFPMVICDCGYTLLVDGTEDSEWMEASQRVVDRYQYPLRPGPVQELGFSVKYHTPFCIQAVSDELTPELLNKVKLMYSRFVVCQSSSREVTISLPFFTKGQSVIRYWNRFGKPRLITAGDTEADHSMLMATRYSYGLDDSPATYQFNKETYLSDRHAFANYILRSVLNAECWT